LGNEMYRVEQALGRGLTSVVYRVIRLSDQQPYALKLLTNEEAREHFLSEARLLETYRHVNLVQVVALHHVQDAQPALLMELLENRESGLLWQRIQQNPLGLPEVEVLHMMDALLQVLEFLHDHPKPIVHRDIKPANIYAPEGQPEALRLLDLGAAKALGEDDSQALVPGTLDYMSPEFAQTGSHRGSPQSDVFALGYVLYEALTGLTPLARLPQDEAAAARAFVERSERAPEIDFSHAVFQQHPMWVRVVAYALAWKPTHRYLSAAEMRADIARIQRGHSNETFEDVVALACSNHTVVAKGQQALVQESGGLDDEIAVLEDRWLLQALAILLLGGLCGGLLMWLF